MFPNSVSFGIQSIFELDWWSCWFDSSRDFFFEHYKYPQPSTRLQQTSDAENNRRVCVLIEVSHVFLVYQSTRFLTFLVFSEDRSVWILLKESDFLVPLKQLVFFNACVSSGRWRLMFSLRKGLGRRESSMLQHGKQ